MIRALDRSLRRPQPSGKGNWRVTLPVLRGKRQLPACGLQDAENGPHELPTCILLIPTCVTKAHLGTPPGPPSGICHPQLHPEGVRHLLSAPAVACEHGKSKVAHEEKPHGEERPRAVRALLPAGRSQSSLHLPTPHPDWVAALPVCLLE